MSYPRFGHAIPSQRDGAKSRPSDFESLGHRPFCPKILKGVRDSQSPVIFAYFCQGTKAKSGLCTSCCGLKSDHSEAIKVRASQLHFKAASPVSTLSTCCSLMQFFGQFFPTKMAELSFLPSLPFAILYE